MALTVFFDVGGTLVDSPDFYAVVAGRLCSEKPLENTRELVFKTFMQIYENRENERVFLKVEDMLAQTLAFLSRKYGYQDISDQAHDLVFEVYLHRSHLFPEVANVLKALFAGGIRMVIASDADRNLMDQELAKFGIESCFSDRCVSESVRSYKPGARFIDCLRNYTTGNEEYCFFVGDNRVDIESGRLLGIKSILIDRNQSGNRFNADFTIQSLNELLPILGLSSQQVPHNIAVGAWIIPGSLAISVIPGAIRRDRLPGNPE